MSTPQRLAGPILFAYDGSEDARAAIGRAGAVLETGPAVAVTAWATFGEVASAALLGMPRGVLAEAVRDIDTATRARAEDIAAEGAQHARAAGFPSEPRAVGGGSSYVAALLGLADELDARVLVMGSRGRSPVSAAVLGSVSAGILYHGGRPVLVVPRQARSSA